MHPAPSAPRSRSAALKSTETSRLISSLTCAFQTKLFSEMESLTEKKEGEKNVKLKTLEELTHHINQLPCCFKQNCYISQSLIQVLIFHKIPGMCGKR